MLELDAQHIYFNGGRMRNVLEGLAELLGHLAAALAAMMVGCLQSL